MEYELRATGKTREIKDTLKARGWRWEPATKSWVLRIDDADAAAIRDGETRKDTLTAKRARLKGCTVRLCYRGTIGDVVYVSPTAPREQGQPVAGQDYCDAAGNYVGGSKIDGSAPDELI